MRTEQPREIRLSDYRAPDFRVPRIELKFVLDPARTHVTARLELERIGPASAPLLLQGDGLKLVGLALDGRPLAAGTYRLEDEDKTLVIAEVPDRFSLEIQTEISPQSNTALEGLYLARGIFCTQCEPEGFRRITYFLDRPDNLTVFTTRIEAPKDQLPVLLSNGNRIEHGELSGGRHFVVWYDPFPKPSYLFALVAGDLGVVEDHFVTMSGRTVKLFIYVEHGNEDQVYYAMDALKRAMKWDEEAYGREYDLDIFMIVAVSAFNMGAMENKGLNIFNDKLLLASPQTATDADYERIESVVAHEYFHNWTGNRITCRDWFQLSLKEGLTVFRDQSFSADMRSAGVKRIGDVQLLRARQFQEDAGPLAHPVQPQSYIAIDNFYTATVYEKGAEVIGMLKTLVGPQIYRKATDLYFDRHDGQAATVEDWVRCFEDASGRDLSQFRLWYRQSGTPAIDAEGTYDAAARRYTLTLKQRLPPTPGQPNKQAMLIPLRLGLVGATSGAALPLALEGENARGPLERVVELSGFEQSFVFTDIAEPPLLSLGRGFSAPVHVHTSLSRQQRAVLMAHDPDDFNRWEAGHALACDVMLAMAQLAQSGREPQPDSTYLDVAGAVLAEAHKDLALSALMLMLPGEAELAQLMHPADPEALHTARTALIRAIARHHVTKLTALYDALSAHSAFSPDAASAGRRALRNMLLRYLTAADDAAAAERAHQHYQGATNMTDMMAGLTALCRMDSPLRPRALADFRDRFATNPLVLDKWLTVQAQSPLPQATADVRRLMQDPAFDLKNPNRVRALVGAFSANHLRFHDASGAGYELIGEVVRQLDPVNPQVAARMAGAFETWRRYDSTRQQRMRSELQKILGLEGISSNLYEVTGKLLG